MQEKIAVGFAFLCLYDWIIGKNRSCSGTAALNGYRPARDAVITRAFVGKFMYKNRM